MQNNKDDLKAMRDIVARQAPAQARKSLRESIKRTVGEGRKLHRQKAPKETRTLRMSTRGKFRSRKRGAFGVFGVESKYARIVKVKKNFFGRWWRTELRKPVKYEHLVSRTGAKPHLIFISRGPAAGLTVRHPGFAPNPYRSTIERAAISFFQRTAASQLQDFMRTMAV